LDLLLSQAYLAARYLADENHQEDLRQEARNFRISVLDKCGIPRSGKAAVELLIRSRACVEAAYRDQRQIWLGRLAGVARQEAERPIELHIALQRDLQRLGYLSSAARIDGAYGLATRTAISAWQERSGLIVDGWISDRAAVRLTDDGRRGQQQMSEATPSIAARAAELERTAAELQQTLQQVPSLNSDNAAMARGTLRSTTAVSQSPVPNLSGQAATRWLVLFEAGRADLTPNSREIVSQAAARIRSSGQQVQIAGHDDRYGTPDRSRELAKLRADAVAFELNRQGIAVSSILVEAFGDEQPIVGTIDGVRNPENRRVEISTTSSAVPARVRLPAASPAPFTQTTSVPNRPIAPSQPLRPTAPATPPAPGPTPEEDAATDALIRSALAARAAEAALVASRIPPEIQGRLVDVVTRYSNEYRRAADNEILKDRLRAQRARELCSLLPGLTVQGWVGTLTKIISDPFTGNARPVIALSPMMEIAAPEIGSLFGSTVHVPRGSALFERLINLNIGQKVSVDGSFYSDPKDCLKEESFMMSTGMRTPSFSFRYNDIRLIQ
jgi:outer membrane protein OmpA-like peptidoglycan-associated protein